MNKKLILLVFFGSGVLLFYLLDLQQHLSLENLKINRDKLDVLYEESAAETWQGI